MSRTLSYLWFILVVCSAHKHIGYGTRTDPQRSSNLSKDRHIPSSDTGYFKLDPSDEKNFENWSNKPKGKRDASINNTINGRTKRVDDQAICGKKSKGGVDWSCKTVASCTFEKKLLPENQQTVCGAEGSPKKICCPKIDSVKVAQEKCREYALKAELAREAYIFRGKVAKEGEFPHMVHIGSGEYSPTSSDPPASPYVPKVKCSGSFISPQYVLTAAHCNGPKSKPSKDLTWVASGTTIKLSTDGDNNVYHIVERINHPEYSRWEKYDNDIALLKIDRPVVFNSTFRPVCLALPPNAIDVYNASQATVVGWGRTNTGQTKTDKLLWAPISLLDNSTCVRFYKNKLNRGFNAKSMICAGRMKPSDGDTCRGDSGGPLQYSINSKDKYYKGMSFQEGITSFGDPDECMDSTGPGVYTRVSNFLPWIQEIVWPIEDLI